MRADELVEVQAVKGHADERAATGWRHEGEVYLTDLGLARRRERAGLVEIQSEAPEEEAEDEEDSEPTTETEQDEEEDSAGDEAPDEFEDEEQEDE